MFVLVVRQERFERESLRVDDEQLGHGLGQSGLGRVVTQSHQSDDASTVERICRRVRHAECEAA